MKIQEYNAETKKTLTRDANEAEIANAASVNLEIQNLRETQTATRSALLQRLGITAEEAQALGL